MKRKLVVLLTALLLPLTAACGVLLTGCDAGSPQKEISNALNVDCRAATVLEYSDTHGGFHGDGMTYAALQFPDASFGDALADNELWRSLPLSDTVHTFLYGGEGRSTAVIDENGKPRFPEVEHGCWYFYDRHAESTDPQDDSQIFRRYSTNLTVAVYDADTKTLYYCKFDT